MIIMLVWKQVVWFIMSHLLLTNYILLLLIQAQSPEVQGYEYDEEESQKQDKIQEMVTSFGVRHNITPSPAMQSISPGVQSLPTPEPQSDSSQLRSRDTPDPPTTTTSSASMQKTVITAHVVEPEESLRQQEDDDDDEDWDSEVRLV